MNYNFEDMKNKELVEFCQENNIDYKKNAKNVSKPTKAELIKSIREWEDSQGTATEEFFEELAEGQEIDPEIDKDIEYNDIPEPVAPVVKKETRHEKRRRQIKELFKLVRVIVTSNRDNQRVVDNPGIAQVERIAWGNRLVGHQVDNVLLGRPWHIREGALRNLRAATIRKSIQDGNDVKFITIPAWNIQELDPLSEREIKELARRQIIRNSSQEQAV